MFENFWCVLHVTANHEKRVVQHLDARAVENYLPLYNERSQWTDRAVQLQRPLFAGYVFTRFTPQQKLSILSVPGVLRLLCGNGYQTVSCEELDRIRLGLEHGYVLRPHPCVSIGTHVRVHGGVFDGVHGLVTELRRECKVVIGLSAVQQCFSLEVQADQLEVLNMPPRLAAGRRPMELVH